MKISNVKAGFCIGVENEVGKHRLELYGVTTLAGPTITFTAQSVSETQIVSSISVRYAECDTKTDKQQLESFSR